jgi:hypothetical protein
MTVPWDMLPMGYPTNERRALMCRYTLQLLTESLARGDITIEHFRWHQPKNAVVDPRLEHRHSPGCGARTRRFAVPGKLSAKFVRCPARVPKRMILVFGSGKNVRGFSSSVAK